MKIAFDYDGTYTIDPNFWDTFLALAKQYGHEVVCVTMRHPHEKIDISCPVIYTGRKAKATFFDADVWIDDNPAWLFHDSM